MKINSVSSLCALKSTFSCLFINFKVLEVRDVLDLSRFYLEDRQREFGGVGSGIVNFDIAQLVGQSSREWGTLLPGVN